MVTAAKNKKDLICNPILAFTENDVWRYIRENKIEVNPLYEMGYKRVGCIGCPLGGSRNMLRAFEDFPKHKQAYIKAFEKMLKRRNEKGLKVGWETGEDVYNWWVYGKEKLKGQMSLEEFLKAGDKS